MIPEPAVVLVSQGAVHVLGSHCLRVDLEHGGATTAGCRYAYVVPESVYDGAGTSADVWDAVDAAQLPLNDPRDAVGRLVHIGDHRERALTSLIADAQDGWAVKRLADDAPHIVVTEEKAWVAENGLWERILPEGQRQLTDPPTGNPRVGRELGGSEVLQVVRLAPPRAIAFTDDVGVVHVLVSDGTRWHMQRFVDLRDPHSRTTGRRRVVSRIQVWRGEDWRDIDARDLHAGDRVIFYTGDRAHDALAISSLIRGYLVTRVRERRRRHFVVTGTRGCGEVDSDTFWEWMPRGGSGHGVPADDALSDARILIELDQAGPGGVS